MQSMSEKVRVGIVGCGVISGIYLKNLPGFEMVEVVACADLLVERAQARAAEYGIKKACTPDELYADPDVELDRKSTRLNSSHLVISYAVFCLKKKKYEMPTRSLIES